MARRHFEISYSDSNGSNMGSSGSSDSSGSNGNMDNSNNDGDDVGSMVEDNTDNSMGSSMALLVFSLAQLLPLHQVSGTSSLHEKKYVQHRMIICLC